MISLLLFVTCAASAIAIPMDVCQNFPFLYNQCLPQTNWMCDKPSGFKYLDVNAVRGQLIKSSPEYINYIKSCAECLGDPSPYSEKVTYKKQPVCREVKVPVQFVNRTVYHDLTGLVIGHEECQVVLNSPESNVQKVYKTECFNGNLKRSDRYCNFDYGTFKQYFCRPTNFVYREMLVYCPSSGLQYFKEKVSTACSCVRMKCVAGLHTGFPVIH